MPLLFGTVEPGLLYNAKLDAPIWGKNLFKNIDYHEEPTVHVDAEIFTEYSVLERLDHFSIDASLSLSFMAGLIKVRSTCLSRHVTIIFIRLREVQDILKMMSQAMKQLGSLQSTTVGVSPKPLPSTLILIQWHALSLMPPMSSLKLLMVSTLILSLKNLFQT